MVECLWVQSPVLQKCERRQTALNILSLGMSPILWFFSLIASSLPVLPIILHVSQSCCEFPCCVCIFSGFSNLIFSFGPHIKTFIHVLYLLLLLSHCYHFESCFFSSQIHKLSFIFFQNGKTDLKVRRHQRKRSFLVISCPEAATGQDPKQVTLGVLPWKMTGTQSGNLSEKETM